MTHNLTHKSIPFDWLCMNGIQCSMVIKRFRSLSIGCNLSDFFNLKQLLLTEYSSIVVQSPDTNHPATISIVLLILDCFALVVSLVYALFGAASMMISFPFVCLLFVTLFRTDGN